MVHSVFASNRPIVLALPVLPAIAYFVFALLNVDPPAHGLGGTAFDALNSAIQGLPWLKLFLGITLNLLGAIVLNNLANAHSYAAKENYFPALVYFLFSSLLLSWNYLNPVLVANLMVLLALRRLLRMYRVQEVSSMIYDAGVFLGLGALFFPPLVLAFPLLWLSLVQLRSFNLREWLVPITGLLTPLLYALVAYWWFGFTPNLSAYLSFKNGILEDVFISRAPAFYPLLILTSVVVLAGFYSFLRDMSTSTVHKKNTKKVFISTSLFLVFIYVYASALQTGQTGLSAILAIPVAVYSSVIFTAQRRKKLVSTLFYLWLLATLVYTFTA